MLDRIENAPRELQDALIQSFTVERYGTYAEGIFSDSVGYHTFRCVDLVDDLPDGSCSKDKIRRRVLSHDLAEIVTTDFTAIQKENAKLSRNLEISERKAAQEILSPEYQQMLEEFNLAGKLLKGDRVENPPPPEALIAKVIDIVENDTYFHLHLRNWICSPQFDRSKMPEEDALSYTFRHSPTQIKSVSESECPEEIKNLCLALLKDKLKKVQEVWSEVDKNLIPGTIQEGLIRIRNLIEVGEEES